MHKKNFMSIVIVVILALITVSLSACGNKASDTKGSVTSESPSQKQIVIGVSLMTLNSPYFEAMKRGLEEEAAAKNIKVVVTDAQLKVADQVSTVENLIAQKVDAILLNAVDSAAVAPAVEAANNANIPIIALDVAPSSGEIVSLVASNNKSAGATAGAYVAGRLSGKGKVAILGGPPISSFTDRIAGFKEEIAKHPDIQIVREKNVVENSSDKFMEAADNMLTSVPDLDAIFAVNDFGALAVDSIVKSSSKQFKVFSIGVDGMPDAVKAISEGEVVGGSVAQQPAEMGKLGIDTALDYLNGNTPQSVIDVPVKLLTKDNAQFFAW